MSQNLPIRPRRLRQTPQMRAMLQQTHLHPSNFILPIFVTEGTNLSKEIPSMPGVHQMSVDVAQKYLSTKSEEGFKSYLIFGVIDRKSKDPMGTAALDENNVVCRLLKSATKIPMVAITDLCFCEYTDHGHCGPLSKDKSTVDNDRTLDLLVKQAINHARSGATIIAPSGMMDGSVSALRTGLDSAGFQDVGILSYAVKYASAFYGPFRDAADSAPAFGDRHSYQMDPARPVQEAIHEAKLDIAEGADMVMVKPAGPYLDIISAVRRQVDVPLVAYQVSGEYSMIQAAAQNNWLDRDRVVLESLTSIKRAGADLIISYFADILSKIL